MSSSASGDENAWIAVKLAGTLLAIQLGSHVFQFS